MPLAGRLKINVVWFKGTDLRVHDHASLQAAHAAGLPVLHLFVFDPVWFAPTPLAGFPRMGPFRAKFQLEAVTDLAKRLATEGHKLTVRTQISTVTAFEELSQDFDIQTVFAFREVCFEERKVEKQVQRVLHRHGARLQTCHGFELYHEKDLAFDPRQRRFGSFTSFRKTVQEGCSIRPAMPAPDLKRTRAATWAKCDPLPDAITAFGYTTCSAVDDSRSEFKMLGGETAAIQRVEEYLFKTHSLELDYVGATMTYDPSKSTLRDKAMFKVGAWLSHGCLSPRYLHEEVRRYELQRGRSKAKSWILHELVWRDFARYASMHADTKIFKLGGLDDEHPVWGWSEDRERLTAWTDGQTGYPYVDAAMRELKATGYCNHMGREVCGWFLVLDLGLDWRLGAEWYESQLLDYEPCSNWFNWVYHCVRVVTQNAQKARGWDCPAAKAPMSPLQTSEVLFWGARHDPDAVYIKKWVPELAALPPTLAREPWLVVQEETRIAADGHLYTEEEFREHYGNDLEWEAASRGGDAVENPVAMDALLGMGFQHGVASKALQRAGMDVDLAVAFLLEEQEQGSVGTIDSSSCAASGNRSMHQFRYGQDYPLPLVPPTSHQDSEAIADHARLEQDRRARRLDLMRQQLYSQSYSSASARSDASGVPAQPAPVDTSKQVRKSRWGRASVE
eukprot:TRINITY_DN34493_c0_g1_i1.p1 TRINITY_DN34493_c0_g1~~TRINITY_DN34493_c0_g1_i1.p1  ORF type:complete len:676 (-),score=74.81 TRINITY_DN34493_c0_g1_i1:361-2388(-)